LSQHRYCNDNNMTVNGESDLTVIFL
jgi:hypothetical protein